MSFRNRLTLFFIVIVIVPMIAVALVLFRLVSDSEEGKGDARLGQAQRAAQGLFMDAQRRAEAAEQRVGSDAGLATAIRAADRGQVQAELERLARRADVQRLRADLDGLGRFDVGAEQPVVAPATSRLVGAEGNRVGRLRISMSSATDYARRVALVTELGVIVQEGQRVTASTVQGLGAGASALPTRGEAKLRGQEYRLTGFQAASFEGRPTVVRVLDDVSDGESVWTATSLVVAGALAGFLLLAFAFALTVSRSLQAQIQRLLDAAQRLGKGDFRIRVPTEGNDEFAALGQEFNAMSRQLESRLEELQQERARLQGAIRRVGESFAKGLDRDALLDIVVQTAVDGVGADCGRATVRNRSDGPPVEIARSGDLMARKDAIRAVESAALQSRAVAETSAGGAHALAQPLRSSEGDLVLGLISVARADREFSDPEKELFNYLASQAALSLENVDLHETVQRQAVTDELTGLFNHRRFQEVMALEVERTRRFGSDMGLIMLDIDNFKRVNDTYGHMQGDLVLREVAQVLRDSAREIDEPARYGGEEMAVALPQTDLEGAYQFAERVRRSIEALELPILDGGNGTERLRVTASFGAAALPKTGDADKEALVAAADAA
ncbi:MAG: diguanylate cyclase, partial [uncultured Solirubrobacteraceae bacterium]